MIAHNPYLKVSAKVAGGHGPTLDKDFCAAADAVRATAAAHGPAAHDAEVR
ncbi:hypothetical protein [Streptomyces sp. NPDC017529]|uniref:hypothetical protein n=1 Tax=Streptomyces sp. NPDC017529 TaxID=3365000 RepID=UPI0037B56831